MFAVKTVNLTTANKSEHFEAAINYADACQTMRRTIADMECAWVQGIDYEIDVVEVDDDFDFDDQSDRN